MNRRLIHIFKLSCSALGLGVVLCACPAGFAPTGTFAGNRDASSVTASKDGGDADDVSVPLAPDGANIPVSGASDGPVLNPVSGNNPIASGPILASPGGDTPNTSSNPVVAGDAGGISARPDGAPVGHLPFVAGARRVWTGTQFNTEVAEGGAVTVVPNAQGTVDLHVIAEYRPPQNNLNWSPYPAGMQVRLILTPKNGNILQSKHYDTVVLPTEDGVRAANIVVEDFPMEEGTLSVFSYEVAYYNENGDQTLMHTPDFSENNLVEFPTFIKAMRFFNSPWTHLLFTVETKAGHQLPALH